MCLKPLFDHFGCVLWIVVLLGEEATAQAQLPHWLHEIFIQDLLVRGGIHHAMDANETTNPLSEKQTHSMLLPPPCLTVGSVLLDSYASPFFCQMVLAILWPNSSLSIFVSSDHSTFDQSSSKSANFRQTANFRCFFYLKGTFLGRYEWSSWRLNALVMVAGNTAMSHCPGRPALSPWGPSLPSMQWPSHPLWSTCRASPPWAQL